MTKQIRQGDVLLERVEKIPKNTKKEQKDNGDVVLAYGEVTGHKHRVLDGAEVLLAENGERYLEATKQTALVHEEHDVAQIGPGFWNVVIQKEYSPAAIRNVAD
jgi:hypothetical protein